MKNIISFGLIFTFIFLVLAALPNSLHALTPPPPCFTYHRELTVGSTGADVVKLQEFLIMKKNLVWTGGEKGYFGELTRKALQDFQIYINDSNPASNMEETGYFGPLTRAYMNKHYVPACGNQSLRVVYPNGGETVAQGEGLSVIWDSFSPLQPVDIKILDSKGKTLAWPIMLNLTPNSADGQSIGFVANATGDLSLALGKYKARVCAAGTNLCDDSNASFTVISPVKNVKPKISRVSPRPVTVGSELTVSVKNAGRSGNIVLQTSDGKKTWTTGYAAEVSHLPGFTKYDGSKLAFTIPYSIGRGVHPDGWWNEPTVSVKPGNYKLYVTASDASNNFVKSNRVTVRIGEDPNTSKLIKVTGPQDGSVFDNGRLQNIIVGWEEYSGDFDYYGISITNMHPSGNVSGLYVSEINKRSNGYVIKSGDMVDFIEELNGSGSVKGGYYVTVHAIKEDRAGEGIIAEGTSGFFEIR